MEPETSAPAAPPADELIPPAAPVDELIPPAAPVDELAPGEVEVVEPVVPLAPVDAGGRVADDDEGYCCARDGAATARAATSAA
ncbi:hypothetical protein DJ021_06870 [Phenylobacterium hankyongense]|uniref:Uncharacterized protein n=1 Tax=Phenylobacterium hankyongense TaxID=1813876 RepID=A0A328AX38_9CAUL|nr:hypothetical protein DJ021_06870 [Phenylobacterium hankyongense]